MDWLDGDLFQRVHELFNQHAIFRSWNDIVGSAPEETRSPGVFHTGLVHNYMDTPAVGVRRLTDENRRINSLVRLLMEVASDSDQLTYAWGMSRAIEGDARAWETRCRELRQEGTDHVDPAFPEGDKVRVIEASEVVKGHVDSHLAHLQRDRGAVAMPTFGDVHGAVDLIYIVFHRWYQVLTGSSLAALRPPVWEHVLARPWTGDSMANELGRRRNDEWENLVSDIGFT